MTALAPYHKSDTTDDPILRSIPQQKRLVAAGRFSHNGSNLSLFLLCARPRDLTPKESIMTRPSRPTILAWYSLLVVLCSQGILAAADKPELKSCELGHIHQVHRFGDIYLAGQPTAEDLAQFKTQGFETVINLRTDGEVSWDEAQAAEQAGLKYIHVPFRGEAELTPKVFDKVLPVLGDKESGPKLLHCGSANRVGALWYAHRILADGLNPVQAELEAKEVGLRNEAYLEKANEYIAAQRAREAKAPAANE